ncbi:MAG: hypothetical protein PHU25_16120 [Deltaproteobacteria bacterium]|nr:hypothetical protein [Deltaproteobacteria bacterium]
MTQNLFRISALVTVLLAGFGVSATPLQKATAGFVGEHASARLVTDGSAGRYFIVYGFTTAPVRGDATAAARSFVLEHATLLGLAAPGADVRLDRVVRHLDTRFVQLGQTLNGLPVFDAHVIVQIDGKGRIVKVSSKAVTGAVSTTTPAISFDEARVSAARGILGPGPTSPGALGYLPVDDGARLAYEFVTPGAGLHRWLTYVDAATGAILFRTDLAKTNDANVFAENPVTDNKETKIVTLPRTDATGDHVNHTWGSLSRVATCTTMDQNGGCTAWAQDAVADDNGFLDILPNLASPTASPDGFSEVNVYYHIDDQNNWMRTEFGYGGTYIDPDTSTEETHLWSYVNMNFANAAYMGGGSYGGDTYPDSIAIGQGVLGAGPVDFAYDADVMTHEFTHSVSSKAFQIGMGRRDEYGLDMSSGGVEEGNADYYSLTRHDNPELGEYALGAYGRDADNDHVCPDDLVGESHSDGWIVSGALWEIRTALGPRKTDHLQYLTLAGAEVRSFADYANALIAQAEVMKAETGDLKFTDADVAVVQGAMEDRNMLDCKRFVSLWQNGAPVEKLSYGMQFDISNGKGTPTGVQYVTPTFGDTEVLKLLITPAADKTYDVLVREGQPVTYEWLGDSYPFDYNVTYDFKWVGTAAAPLTEAKISGLTELKLKKNTSYYFSIICKPQQQGCQSLVTMSVSATPDTSEPDAGADGGADTDTGAAADAGTDAGNGNDSSGCGCGTTGSAAAGGSLLAGLLDVLALSMTTPD